MFCQFQAVFHNRDGILGLLGFMIYGDMFAAFWGKRELWTQAVPVLALSPPELILWCLEKACVRATLDEYILRVTRVCRVHLFLHGLSCL